MILSLIAAVPEPLQGLLAALAVAGFVLAFTPAFVGFVGLIQRKPLEQCRDDATYALYAAVPLAGLAAIATIIYLVGTS